MRTYDDAQWRNTGYSARMGLMFMSIDARGFIPVLGVIFHISMTTIYIFSGVLAFFALLEYMGYSAPVAIRKARSMIAGRHRFVQRTVSRRRRMAHG